MSVRKRKWRDKQGRVLEKWMVHIEYTSPTGSQQTIRKVSPVQTKRGAEQFEREVRQALLDGSIGKEQTQTQTRESEPVPEPGQAPTFAEFAAEFLAPAEEIGPLLAGLTTSTSPPALLVLTVAVPSPGSGVVSLVSW